jgi:hypothetical protein
LEYAIEFIKRNNPNETVTLIESRETEFASKIKTRIYNLCRSNKEEFFTIEDGDMKIFDLIFNQNCSKVSENKISQLGICPHCFEFSINLFHHKNRCLDKNYTLPEDFMILINKKLRKYIRELDRVSFSEALKDAMTLLDTDEFISLKANNPNLYSKVKTHLDVLYITL